MREVAQPKAPVRPLEDVGGADGAMDDPPVVQVCYSLAYVARDVADRQVVVGVALLMGPDQNK